MLGKILKKDDCAKCQFCCCFDESDFWEMPLFDLDAVNYIKPVVDVDFQQVGTKFIPIPTFNYEGLYYCPALSSKGCILPNEFKPIECKLWPFRIMQINEKLYLTLSEGCNVINNLNDLDITDFVNNNILKFAQDIVKVKSDIVRPYVEGYKIIKEI